MEREKEERTKTKNKKKRKMGFLRWKERLVGSCFVSYRVDRLCRVVLCLSPHFVIDAKCDDLWPSVTMCEQIEPCRARVYARSSFSFVFLFVGEYFLSWVFILSRSIHGQIHNTTARVLRRRKTKQNNVLFLFCFCFVFAGPPERENR